MHKNSWAQTELQWLPLRIVEQMFKKGDSYYSSTYFTDECTTCTLQVRKDSVSNLSKCTELEQKLYNELSCYSEHIISMLFFYTLGIQN